MATAKTAPEPELVFATQRDFAAWLAKHHASLRGIRLVIAKKGSTVRSVTYPEAIDVALAWGWIDGTKRARNAETWLQRFSPRTAKSLWSKINRQKATALIAAGAMHPPGLAEVARAKKDGRWKAAYDSPRTSTVPPDLKEALDANRRARAFFETIDGTNRYSILHRVMTAKKPETRADRIARFVKMLASGETLHPPRRKR